MPDPLVPAGDPNEDLLEVINHAIENETGELPEEPEVELDEDGNPIEPDDDSEDDPVVPPDGEGDELDEQGEPRQRNADGTFKSAEQIAAEATAAAAAEAAKPAIDPKTGKPVVAAKPADPINDPIPKDLKPATQERIRSVIAIAKEAETRAATAEQNFDFLVKGVQATGTTPEQYGEMLSFMALFNSQDPAQQEQALSIAVDFATRLSTLLGKEFAPSDPMAGHDDLKAAVAAGQVTAKYAAEIARTRNQTAFRGELSGNARQQQEQQRAFETEQTQARADLTALEVQLRGSDPHWMAKKAQLVPILQPIFKTLPPRQWAQAFQQAYANLKFTPPAAVRKPAIPANQPSRAGKGNPGGGGNGLNKEAGSALEAMNAALGELAGGK